MPSVLGREVIVLVLPRVRCCGLVYQTTPSALDVLHQREGMFTPLLHRGMHAAGNVYYISLYYKL
jgi:hypothetical protein